MAEDRELAMSKRHVKSMERLLKGTKLLPPSLRVIMSPYRTSQVILQRDGPKLAQLLSALATTRTSARWMAARG